MTSDSKSDAPVPTFDPDSARRFCADLSQTVDTLIEVLSEETRLIKAAKLTAAAAMTSQKSVVSERYMKAHGVLRVAGQDLSRLAPDEVGHLRERHQALESAISLNLAVLATARTVSETLIKGVGETVVRHRGRTDTYGADARQSTHAPGAGPMSCNVAL